MIKKVYGPDTPCDGEQVFFSVGHNCLNIEERDDNLGTYGIKWFVVTTDNGSVISLNAMYVFGVEREQPEPIL